MILEKCTPMVSDVLDIKCSLNGVNVNCSKPSEPGTILTQSCKVENAHNSPREKGLIKADNELHCLKNAKWSGQLLTTCTSRNYTMIKNVVYNTLKLACRLSYKTNRTFWNSIT